MSLNHESGQVVHFPKNPDVFQFDAEVASIFPEMARRAIPMYLEAHRAHAAMLRGVITSNKLPISILDIGASRGQFFHALIDRYGHEFVMNPKVECLAIDSSEAMCQHMRDDFYGMSIKVEDVDITSQEFFEWGSEQFDIINMMYVLQFIHPARQEAVLEKVCSLVKPGGVLILGQKDRSDSMVGSTAHVEYLEFRRRNGYTDEEIAAKTQALKGSMYPMHHERLRRLVYASGFIEVYETTRWMMFNTLYCIK